MVKKMVNSATATVSHCFGGYVLPEGLTEGEVVRLLQFDHGYYNVECRDGRQFHVASNCIVPVPDEFYSNHRAETFLKRLRALFRPSEGRARLCISTSFKYLRFAVLATTTNRVAHWKFTRTRFSILDRNFASGSAVGCWRCERGLTGLEVQDARSFLAAQSDSLNCNNASGNDHRLCHCCARSRLGNRGKYQRRSEPQESPKASGGVAAKTYSRVAETKGHWIRDRENLNGNSALTPSYPAKNSASNYGRNRLKCIALQPIVDVNESFCARLVTFATGN
jgi:hypothetical protein